MATPQRLRTRGGARPRRARPGAGIEPPPERPLRAYAFDPGRGQRLGNELALRVRYQELDPGPVVRHPAGDAIAVVDYDGGSGTWYRPVDLDDPGVLIRGGLAPSESDPRFHQQMVYAVVSDTIQHFEAALGRQVHWRRQERTGAGRGPLPGDIHTLALFPHAMRAANAFYSPRAHGILFGYFRADPGGPGRYLPGQTVFTCLSHDIVVHETTHAIVDGVRGLFTEQTNPDVPAFHEAFADLAALFRHFSHREVLLDTIQRTGGALHRTQLRPLAAAPGGGPAGAFGAAQPNPLVQLAQQFGEATGHGQGLRSALGTPPRSDDLARFTEPHQRGSVLVSAVFDAFFSVYLRRTADLFRIFRAGGGSDQPLELPGPLAERLADEAGRTADQFFRGCVRALDYCPPVDITFGDWLRALVTADLDLHPRDELGVRDALLQAFRQRGIVPEGASFFSEAAIAWPRPEPGRLPPVRGLDFGDPDGLTRAQRDHDGEVLRRYVRDPATREALGFPPGPPVTVPSFHPVFRVDPDGGLRTDMVVELVQRRDVPFDPAEPRLGTFPHRGGVTLLLSRPPVEGREDPRQGAAVRYLVPRHLDAAREARQRAYGLRLGLLEGSDPDRFQVDFALVHGGG